MELQSIGLLLLGIIQLGTCITMLFFPKYADQFGIPALTGKLSIYRYMLSSLWLSVAIVYFLGAFNPAFTLLASILGVLNAAGEIAGYWKGFRNNKETKHFPVYGSLCMGIPAVLCLFNIF